MSRTFCVPRDQARLDALNDTGRVLLTHTRVRDGSVICVSIGSQQAGLSPVDPVRALIEERA